MRTTFEILQGRCVTGGTKREYFENFSARAKKRLEKWIRSNPDTAAHLKGNLSQCPTELSQAILELNQHPGLDKLDPNPSLGEHGNMSAFMQRLKDNGKEFLRAGTQSVIELSSPSLIGTARESILEGQTSFDHMVGGKATRMSLDREKFLLTPNELRGHYLKLGLDQNIPLPRMLPTKEWQLGVRHMLAFSYSIYRLAQETEQNWRDALAKQTVFMVANETIMNDIINLFKEWSYFGLDRDNVYFMESADFQVLQLNDNGELEAINNRTIHNHGVARIQATMEESWFKIGHNDQREPQSRQVMKEVAESHTSHDSLNIEDTGYLTNAIDIYANMLMLGLPLPKEMEKFAMMMKIVGQRKPPQNPQKGGVLALEPDFYGTEKGRVAVYESFQLSPRFHHHDRVAAKLRYATIAWLNDNKNSYAPGALFDQLATTGLPISFEVKNGGYRNESPQGDLNYFLRTLYVANLQRVNGKERTISIANLKDPQDIPSGLQAMHQQEALVNFISFAQQFKN